MGLATAAVGALEGQGGDMADHWRFAFETSRSAATPGGDPKALETKRRLGLAALRRQRERLEELCRQQRVDADSFLILQEELDFMEVTLTSEGERHIEVS